MRVVCRVRPASAAEAAEAAAASAGGPPLSFPSVDPELSGRAVALALPPPPGEAKRGPGGREPAGTQYTFAFDKVFDPSASQAAVFEEVGPAVQSALDGQRVCIFAYGQTGSGKTHTMLGETGADGAGAIPRALDLIFDSVARLGRQGWSYRLTATMLEVYNEAILDLLAAPAAAPAAADWDRQPDRPNAGRTVEVRHDERAGTAVAGAVAVEVADAGQVASLLARAAAARSVGATQCNERSSRSHMARPAPTDSGRGFGRGALKL